MLQLKSVFATGVVSQKKLLKLEEGDILTTGNAPILYNKPDLYVNGNKVKKNLKIIVKNNILGLKEDNS